MLGRNVLLAGLLAGLGSAFAGSRIAGAATHGNMPVPAYRVRGGSRDPGRDPDTLPEGTKRDMAARGTHYFKAGRLRSKKRLLNNIPSGVAPRSANYRRGENPIGVNGIRGKSGGGR